jgi:hypothetical protein
MLILVLLVRKNKRDETRLMTNYSKVERKMIKGSSRVAQRRTLNISLSMTFVAFIGIFTSIFAGLDLSLFVGFLFLAFMGVFKLIVLRYQILVNKLTGNERDLNGEGLKKGSNVGD